MKIKALLTICTGDTVMVEVMCAASGYSMVRRKGATPFICRTKQLSPHQKPSKPITTNERA